jgi:hypothetical protein
VFSATLLASKSAITARFERDSHIRASAIPQATALAKRLLGSGARTCEDIDIGKPIDDTHLQCTALLEEKKEIPVLLEILDEDEHAPGIRVLLGFNESAIVQINEALSAKRNHDGERCINVDRKRKLRKSEFSLRALFPTAEPRGVLIRQDGYDLDVTPEAYHALTQAGVRNVSSGWSMLAPEHYKRGRAEEFSVEYASDEDSVRVTIEHKVISEYAGFDLRSHVLRDRDTWAESRPEVQVSPLNPWSAASGLAGHGWSARKDKVLRVRYYVMHEQHLATITFLTHAAEGVKSSDFDEIVSTLRYDDQVQIPGL